MTRDTQVKMVLALPYPARETSVNISEELTEMLLKFTVAMACIGVISVLLTGVSCGRGNGNLKISVQDSSYNTLWGAKVVSESQPAGQLKIDGITEQEKGGAMFNNIKAGTYNIQVSAPGFAQISLDVTLSSGKTQSVTVVLYYASPPPVT